MNDRKFTARALEALRLAQEASAQMGHGYVGSEHLLLGLASEGQGLAARVLAENRMDPETVRASIARLVGVGAPGCSPTQGLTPRCKHIIELALDESQRLGHRYVGTEHLLLGLLREGDGVAARILVGSGLDLKRLYGEVTAALGGQPLPFHPPRPREPREESSKDSKLLEQFSRDLTRLAAQGKLDPVTGREKELRRVIQILTRRTKNNPVLLGEPGVGKTAVAEGLALRICGGDVPDPLRGKRLLALDLSSMVAGTKYRGEFEERVKRLLKEIQRAGNILVFLDEIHTLVGAGSAEGAIDAANILKPALGRSELQVIGATTLEEYRRYIEKDAALERRFQPVTVEEPAPAEALTILKALRDKYEAHHRLSITDGALDAAVELSRRYLPARFLPDKAIDLMDEAASRVRLEDAGPPAALRGLEGRHRQALRELEEAVHGQDFERAALLRDAEASFRRQLEEARLAWYTGADRERRPVEAGDVAAVVSDWTGIPVTALTEEESKRLLKLEEALHKRVVGQEDAVQAVARAIRRGRTGLKDPKRPMGSFLFPGPSGVGKTELSKALAEALFGTEEALLRFDMSEYMEAHTVSRLIGSPPGYVGHEEGGQLTERVRRRPYAVVLFDELEKANGEIWNLLLQILEDGVLTDAHGRRTDFRNTVVVMTTNAGARQLSRTPLGFSNGGQADARQAVERELKQLFRPEFLNRVDEVIVFQSLTEEERKRVAALMGRETARRLESSGVTLELEDSALTVIAGQGTNPEYGVRPLRRYLQRHLEDEAADLLLRGALASGDRLRVTGEDGRLKLSPKKSLAKGNFSPPPSSKQTAPSFLERKEAKEL
ncbi:MAG: ATP-dependent Clp protease ATP-binding subunit [Oscillospiraceae bacterium]|nr:ATP-dependent Clp protease ATP-binding subunit [Oscillospiraceae bacterium]